MMYRPVLLAAPVLLVGCAPGSGGYPSLAARPVEARSWAEPAPPPPAPPVADPALDARIASVTRTLAASAAAFDAADRRATPLVRAARGAAAGSERWVAAQSALALLDVQQAATGESASALEELATARAQALQPDYPALASAQADAAALLAREAARIGALQSTLPPG